MNIEIQNVGKAYISQVLPGIYSVDGVYAAVRGCGNGKKIMQAVTDWADASEVTLELRCQPIGKTYGKNRVMNTAELVGFYSKFGFVAVSETFMRRAA